MVVCLGSDFFEGLGSSDWGLMLYVVIVKDKVNALHSAHAREHIVLRGLGLLEAVALGFGAELGHRRAKTHQRVHQLFDVEALLMSQSWGLLNGIASGCSSQHICCSEKLPEHVLVLLVGGGLTLSVQALDRLRAAEATQAALKLLEAEVGRLRDSHHVL